MSNVPLKDKKIFFVVNPISGNGKAKKSFPLIEDFLKENELIYEKIITQYKDHATQIATELSARDDIEIIVVVGGDGTLYEVINGLFISKVKIPVGYIPTGTGNDYGRHMNIPTDPIEALKRIIEKDVKEIDVGHINNHYFINVASMGFDAEVANYANTSKLKKYIGKLVYVIGVIKSLWSFTPKRLGLEIDGNHYIFDNVWLIAVANNRYYGGGMLISPNSVNDDGLFEVCIIKDLSKLQLLKLFPTIFKGNHIKYYPKVIMMKGQTVKIEANEETTIQSDGEILSADTLVLNNLNKSLKVV